MDSVTQAVLGGVVGELVLGRKIGGKGMVWGLFFGTLPDLDILVFPWLDQVEKLRWHRGISHSFLMMVVAAFVFAKPLAWVHRKQGVSARRAWWFVFLVWSTHVLIDVFTSYGTQVYEPFSDARVAWSNLFIIDLFFTLPLLFRVVYRGWRGLQNFRELVVYHYSGSEPDVRPKFDEVSRKGATLVMSISCLYVAFSLVMKLWAMDRIQGQMVEEIPDGELVAVAPTPFNTILWRGLIETKKGYFVTHWSPFDEGPAGYYFFAKQHELCESFQEEEMFEGLKWFSRGHWVARETPDGDVEFIDIRFGEVRDHEAGKLLPMFRWHLSYDDQGGFEAERPPRRVKMGDTLSALWKRLLGNRREWEGLEAF
ncbi:metal-dependent hydrolase [Akkermansiaceae bacterium]|nr:metal-dependent hydrolase [Akkermansiaceae bacterium]MDF1711602.1 metal-dependent hydrolase [Akkermansiaceae bacterium]